MTEVQERIMVLMDEINLICEKESLRYVLINDTAVRAKKKHAFVDARFKFKLLMPMEDIVKFQAYVDAHFAENRAIESWENNSELYAMVFRYVDKNSLLIDGPAGRYLKMPGIAVTIYPARCGRPEERVVGAERYLQQINNHAGNRWKNSWFFLKLRAHRARKNDKATRYYADHMFFGRLQYLLGGRDKLARWILAHQNRQGAENADGYWYMKKNSQMIRLPEDMFTEVEWITFEDRQVCIPGKPENYWTDKDPNERTGMSTAIRVICECDLPYEEYLEFVEDQPGTSLKQLMQHYREYTQWMGSVYYPMEKKVSHTFLGVRRSVDRIDVWYALRKKREAIREAYQKQDIPQLEKLLKTYLDKTDQYWKARIGFYIDEELFQCARLVWESRGKIKYADKIYKLVPDLYKTESVEDTLANGRNQ